MKLLAFTIILILNITLFAQTGSLSGKVSDKNGPLPSVNVFILNTNLGAGADGNGNYKIIGIPAGEHEVRFSAIGHQTKVIDVEIYPNKTTELNIFLDEAVIEIQSVQVTGMKVQQQNDTRTSLIDLNPRNAKILPGAAEDRAPCGRVEQTGLHRIGRDAAIARQQGNVETARKISIDCRRASATHRSPPRLARRL